MDKNIEMLKRTVLFKDCSREEMDLAIGFFQERHIKEHMTIFTEKFPAEALYVIKSGRVRMSIMAREGEEKSLVTYGPGEFFGELALLQEESRLVTARTETPAELLLLTRKDFNALMELDPSTASKMLLAIGRLLAMRVKAYSLRLREVLLG